MNVEQLMTGAVAICRATDTLNDAAKIMWERDCGAVPVVDDAGRPIAMITDRDVCIASYTQGQPLFAIPISSAMSKTIVTCREGESLSTAEAVMRGQQIRRLPIVDADGCLIGILSLNDIATHGRLKHGAGVVRDGLAAEAIAGTLSAICSRTPVANAAE